MNGKHFAALCTILMGLLLAGCAAAAPSDAIDTPQATAAIEAATATEATVTPTPTQTEGTSLRRPTTPLPISPVIATLPPDAIKVGPEGKMPTDGQTAALVSTGDAVTLNPAALEGNGAELTNGQGGQKHTLTADQTQQLTDLLAGWSFARGNVDATATPAAGWLWSIRYIDANGNTTLALSLADANTLVAGDVRLNLTSDQSKALASLLPALFDAAK